MADSDFSVSADDAVCFSAGLTGAPFGAGTIHAYLASDRQPPRVAAGISLGAVSAAAMERCYRDLIGSRHIQLGSEGVRWNWYRRYLSFLLDRPFDVVWDAIPDPSDLVADLPPVKDPCLPLDDDGNVHPEAKKRDVNARRKLYLISKMGSWLAHLPIKISSIAWLIVRYVRFREKYPRHWLLQTWNFLCLQANLLGILWRLLAHAARPFWVNEWLFRTNHQQIHQPGQPVRPLFGWAVWGVSLIMFLVLLGVGGVNVGEAAIHLWKSKGSFWGALWTIHWWHPWVFLAVALAPILPVYLLLLVKRFAGSSIQTGRDWILDRVLVNLGMNESLLSDFPLLLKLYRLFGAGMKVKDCEFPVLLVAAPLQILPPDPRSLTPVEGPNQLWASTSSEVDVVLALRASLAESPWFSPLRVENHPDQDYRKAWNYNFNQTRRLDLVDGAAVRHNPLPALYGYLKLHPEKTKILNQDHARVHLVYDVPIRWKPEPPESLPDHLDKEPRLPNIVETAFEGLKLAHRRDSRLEVVRTRQISEIERALKPYLGDVTEEACTATIDEIAPQDELRLKNRLKPDETEILTHIAAGCRQTLCVLYQNQLSTHCETDCWLFLRTRAVKRNWDEVASPELPGLAEVCRHCTRKLRAAEKPPAKTLPKAFHAGTGKLAKLFPNLSGARPRIVFLASGGVFRGSFHIGMLGGMLALDIKPDLIVGASVGSLIGAALGSIMSLEDKGVARDRLQRLARLFLEVDSRVALTKTFKSAMKDLGIRGRSPSLRFSPNQLRRMVKRGSRKDAGIAATGAPPALIDAISDLFLIPYRRTARIAADFVAGHFSKAIHDFWGQISTETIDRLGIHEAMLGATLIEKEIRLLLKDDLQGTDPMSQLQPFLKRDGITKSDGIAFFATAVNLVTESITTLGTELDRTSYDFLEALLATSAFPAAFAPRRASTLYPGVGRRDIFYGDGGMFDNLPAWPAFEVLAEVQRDYLGGEPGEGVTRGELRRRYRNPDLFIAGSLDVKQQSNLYESYDGVFRCWKRARKLADNEKINGFERSTQNIDRLLAQVAQQPGSDGERIGHGSEELLNGIVNSAFLPVFPSDEDHLNGTFEFCPSLGLDREKVERSIADGCFQMLHTIRTSQEAAGNSLLKRTLAASKIARLAGQSDRSSAGVCPFFQTLTHEIMCPFHGAAEIHRVCVEDPKHQQYAHAHA